MDNNTNLCLVAKAKEEKRMIWMNDILTTNIRCAEIQVQITLPYKLKCSFRVKTFLLNRHS